MQLELTRAGDYAIRVMLALHAAGGRQLSVRDLAATERIPVSFLPQVMAGLAVAGLVVGRTGRNGGYRLGRAPDAISVLDVIEAVEGDPRRTRCVLRGSPCRVDGVCAVHSVFAAAQEALLATLASTSLAALADGSGQGVSTPGAGPRRIA